MDLANALGEMFRRELQAQLAPLQSAVRRMTDGLESLELLRSATLRLSPLTSRLGSMAGVRSPSSVLPAPAAKRGPGRPPKLVVKPAAALGRSAAAKAPAPSQAPVATKRAQADGGMRACAIIGCKRQSRSKGYCSAHYQKLRLLMRTNRRPADWKDDASPQSVREVKLPRGRAASKALKEAAPRASAPSAAPPKAKAKAKKATKAPKAKATKAPKVSKAPKASKPKAPVRKKAGKGGKRGRASLR